MAISARSNSFDTFRQVPRRFVTFRHASNNFATPDETGRKGGIGRKAGFNTFQQVPGILTHFVLRFRVSYQFRTAVRNFGELCETVGNGVSPV